MLPTPSTSHVVFDNVYEPAEDSFLFLDTLSKHSEVAFLSRRFHRSLCSSPLVLEVGSGSGVVLSFVASNATSLLGRQDVLTMGADVNVFACKATAQTVFRNLAGGTRLGSGAFLDCVNADLTSAMRRGCVDIVLFNPPYVPSESLPALSGSVDDFREKDCSNPEVRFQRDSNLLALATDGGSDGMQVTARFLQQLKWVLNPVRGVAYVLLCAQNKPETVKRQILAWGPSWSVETVGSSGKQAGWEKLQIIRLSRQPTSLSASDVDGNA